MSIPGAASPLFLSAAAAAEAAAFQIDRSIRINDDDTAYLNRTPSSASNRKTWTWSAWVKRGKISEEANLFSVGASSTDAAFRFNTDDTLQVRDGGGGELTTNAVFKDPSAWYHIVVALDNTQNTNTDRFKVYVNGTEQTYSASSYASQNADGDFNTAVAHYIGRQVHNTSNLFDGYLTEIHFVDGTQLAASDFGEYDSNNVWQPKDCQSSLTYGTNGFYLKFADNSSASALGTDSSGNSNTWTVNNLDPVESIGLPSGYTADGSTYSGTLSSIETDDTNGIRAASSHIDFDLGASYTVGTVTAKFINNEGSASANYRIELHGNSSYSNLLANSATVNSSAGSAQTITHDFGSTSAQYLRFSYQGGGRVGTLRFLSTTGATSGNADCDSLIDTPTNYTAESGNNGGNYCTMNPLDNGQGTQPTFSNGNLETENTGSNTTWTSCRGTIGMKTGKWYFEWTNRYAGGGLYGIANAAASTNPVGTGTGGWTWGGANRYFDGSSGGTGLASNHQVDDVIQIAFDADTGKLWFGRNGTFYDSSWGTTGNPGAGTNNTTSVTTGVDYFPALANLGSSGQSNADPSAFNAGQRPFTYTPPTGFVSLCTQNLPDPTIADGSTAMDILTWTGNDATRTLSGLGFESTVGLAWVKNRGASVNHVLQDVVRGFTTGKKLASNIADAEGTSGSLADSYGYISGASSTGFTINKSGTGQDWVQMNKSSNTYVGWAWDGGTSTVSNTDGSITTNVRANASAGFSIIGYTGNATVGATIGHGLNSAPEWFVFKVRSDSGNWYSYHKAYGATKYLTWDRTHTAVANSYLNNTEPTSSVITLSNTFEVNGVNEDIICFAWTSVSGYSSFGSYTGNGSNSGPFVFLGFRPRWVLIKSSTSTQEWYVHDSERDPINPVENALRPSMSNSVSTTGDRMIFLSNGFRVTRQNADMNGSGQTFIYAAFAEHPFKTSRAR